VGKTLPLQSPCPPPTAHIHGYKLSCKTTSPKTIHNLPIRANPLPIKREPRSSFFIARYPDTSIAKKLNTTPDQSTSNNPCQSVKIRGQKSSFPDSGLPDLQVELQNNVPYGPLCAPCGRPSLRAQSPIKNAKQAPRRSLRNQPLSALLPDESQLFPAAGSARP